AAALPHLWAECWAAAHEPGQPADLLARLHGRLEEALPEGVYVEATLARLRPDGSGVVSPGGGSRGLVAQGGGGGVARLRGGWLGFMAPSEREQRSWTLAEGDEMLLGSDGLFDHVDAASDLVERLGAPDAGRSLFAAVRGLLEQALRRQPQKDDITVIL